MAEKKNPFQDVKVVYRRSKPLTKVVVIAAIVLSMAALITLRWAQSDIEAETQKMREEAAQLTYENAELEEDISELGSVKSILEIAMEKLGLVDPNTVIVQPE